MKVEYERLPSEEFENPPEFERMPYPLTPPEEMEAVGEEVPDTEAPIILRDLLSDLETLVEKWKTASHQERMKLSSAHPAHDVPMEYRAGTVEGLQEAIRDVEKLLAEVRG